MERYLCVHAHFYQPPRENPWLEAIEVQDSAHPYHDWNERIAAECYVPNAASRLLDGEGRILDIVNNYARVSFNMGPTLLSWLEQHAPDAYGQILAADHQSREQRGGHGNALAQVYNHMIMPLANPRDRETQVLWGIADFRHRFGRDPEGMWLAETAVDIPTLELLARHGIQFTILAPRQAAKIRKIKGGGRWRDVSNSRIDPSRAYRCQLPSGRSISLFFYDGPISQAVAFEKLLTSGEHFANRLLQGFSGERTWPQLMHIATDGESYGHHHRFGDMALAYALDTIESRGLARMTNYGEYLELHPPTHDVQIFENSSWSCVHGIERWQSDCGCNSGGRSDWHQAWRRPLREALDWLRDALTGLYEACLHTLEVDPWAARDAYIQVILDRSEEMSRGFADAHLPARAGDDERAMLFRSLEMQRHALLMYTSCGWFFDEISGIETVQILQYAGRAIQLAQELGTDLEESFLERLALAKSNMPEHGDGAALYRKFVRPAMVDLQRVAAHYAVSSLYEEYGERTDIYHYSIDREDFWQSAAEPVKLALGLLTVHSRLSWEGTRVSYCVLSFGNHAVNGGVRIFRGDEAYEAMKNEIAANFERGSYADILRLMESHFGMHTYSLMDLFRDEQRKILQILTNQAVEASIEAYREMFHRNRGLMGFLQHTGMNIPRMLLNAAEYVLNYDLWQTLLADKLDSQRAQEILTEIDVLAVPIDSLKVELVVRRKLEALLQHFQGDVHDHEFLEHIRQILELLDTVHAEVNLWQVQNIYHAMARSMALQFAEQTPAADPETASWLAEFRELGVRLFFNIDALFAATTLGAAAAGGDAR